jgi:serine/threonine protein kinase
MLKKSVVLKLKQVEHINSEKSILERVQHPFVIKLLDTFQDEAYLYMLFEFVNGGELFSRLRREGRFAKDVALFYACEILLVFEYLHGMQVAYRDLKPENILIDRYGHFKITDFGFAKVLTDKSYTMCGTPEYLAPEIIRGHWHGVAADWWALILIYEMVAGFPPFYAKNPHEIYDKILSGLSSPESSVGRSRTCSRNYCKATPSNAMELTPTELKASRVTSGSEESIGTESSEEKFRLLGNLSCRGLKTRTSSTLALLEQRGLGPSRM